jgi:hypothetical protein
MIRPKDIVVLAALAWWLLRDREETSVSLTQTCVFPDGSTVHVPLGSSCPGASVLLTGENVIGDSEQWWSGQLPDARKSPYAGMEVQGYGCSCGGRCAECNG